MAPITTIDCERTVLKRFELVLLAAARARALMRGETPRVLPDGDIPIAIALREIAADRIPLRQRLLLPQIDDDEEPDGPTGMAGPSANELRGVAGATAAEGAATTASLAREAPLTTN